MNYADVHDPFLEHFLPGDSAPMRKLRATIAHVNRQYKNPPNMGRTILLVGETGVGKTHLARVIAGHLYWLRDSKIWQSAPAIGRPRTLLQLTAESFKEVALPNLSADLIESALFGHVKGAFTGAYTDKDGYFSDDEIQDLLLDEFGDASAALQAKLLQVLNDGSFQRVGAAPTETKTTSARIFLATNRDLAALVRSAQFRADLYWRVQHLVIEIPPLREQPERIPALAEAIIESTLRGADRSAMALRLSAADLDWAKRQPWPGNVREFERLCWRWVYEGGKYSLEEIQKAYPPVALDPRHDSRGIKDLLRAMLSQRLDRGERLSTSVGEFARGMELEVQRSLYELKEELSLDRDALETLFGDGLRAAKQISAWGEGVRSK
jgi:transcriptional regulator with GAF, ATPase, and Fis domain